MIVGTVAIVAVIAVVTIRKIHRRARSGDGLGGLEQPILDEAIDSRDRQSDKMNSSW